MNPGNGRYGFQCLKHGRLSDGRRLIGPLLDQIRSDLQPIPWENKVRLSGSSSGFNGWLFVCQKSDAIRIAWWIAIAGATALLAGWHAEFQSLRLQSDLKVAPKLAELLRASGERRHGRADLQLHTAHHQRWGPGLSCHRTNFE